MGNGLAGGTVFFFMRNKAVIFSLSLPNYEKNSLYPRKLPLGRSRESDVGHLRLLCGGGKYKPFIFVKNFHEEFLSDRERESLEIIELPREPQFQSMAMARLIAGLIREMSIDVMVIPVHPLKYLEIIRRESGNRCKFVFHHHSSPLWEVENRISVKLHAAKTSGSWLKTLECYLFSIPKERLFKAYTRRFSRIYRRTYAAVDRYLVLCEEYRGQIERIVKVSPADSKVRALTNPHINRSTPDLHKHREVLYVGRLSYADKRVDRLLRIWSQVEADFPDWELKVVGDGRERRNLEKMADDLGLRRVRFCGHSTRVEEHYATAAILCLTSSFEGWGLVLVEAQAAGVVPIAFGCSGGVRRIVGSDRSTGILVTPFDERAYAEELAALMRDEGLRRAMQPAMIAKVSEYSLENTGRMWDRMFDELTGE